MTIRICGDEAMRQPLKDLAAICAGQGAPQGDHNYCENGTPFIKAGNLQELLEGKAITSIQKVSDEVAKKHKLRLYPKGTILFAKSGMSCIKGYIYVLPQSAYVVSHLACITPNEDISEYLRYYFNYHKPNQLVKDAAYPSISLSDVGNLVVDMKPESERNEIVSVLQHTESIITLRQQQLQKLNELVKARFIELFGTETEFDKWPCCTIGDVADVCVGVVIKPTQYYTDKGIPAFRSLNIGEMHVKDSDWVYFTEEGHQKNQKSVVHKNDVLVVRSGAPGTACVATEKYDGYNAVDIIIAHPDNSKVNSIFLAAFTNMPHGMNQIRERTGGAAQQHFNVGGYKAMRLIMPSIELQNQYAAFAEQTDKSKVAVQKALDEAQLLFDSLMQKYFG